MTTLDRRILNLALPSIVSNITVPLLGLCDVTIMGHVGGARHIGAIAVGSMIFNVMYWLFGFLRMSTSGLTAQSLGARRLDLAVAQLRQALAIGCGIGLMFVVMQVPFRQLSLWLMQASADIGPMVSAYYNICIWGAPAVLGLYGLTGWYVGMQNTRIPMMIAIGQNVVNILVSLLLVLVFRMGITGVALGTVIAQWAGFAVALSLLSRYYGKMLRRNLKASKSRNVEMSKSRTLNLNLDIFLRTVCLVAVNLYFTSAGSAQGAAILAANTLLMQFFTFFSYVMDGFAYAGEALAGRYYGAGDRPMLSQTVRRLFGWGGAVVMVFTLAYWLGGTGILRLLTTDALVVGTARDYLPWVVFIPLAGVAAFIWDGIFIGITASRGMLLSCFVGAAAFFLLYFLLFPSIGNHALWVALLVYLFLRGVVLTVVYKSHIINKSCISCTDH